MSLRQILALAFVWFAFTGCSVAQSVAAASPLANLPADMSAALAHEYGNYAEVVTWESLLNDLQNVDVVCIGEAHYDARDMETGFEIVRNLAQRSKIALAVERFSYDLQSRLEHLQMLDHPTAREAEVETILKSETYQTVWGSHSFDQSGFPVNTPSQPVFEAMVKWAARKQIPMIALDVTWEERAAGMGEELARRNQLWQAQIKKFLQRHPREEYQVIVVGGINHITNAPDSFPSSMKSDSNAQVISIGQRDAMYNYRSSTRVATLAEIYSFDDLIVRQPEFALVNVKGVAALEQPPDYWIAVHAVAHWDGR